MMRMPTQNKRPRKVSTMNFVAPTGGWIANRALAHVTAGALAGAYGWPAIIVSWLIICSGIALRVGR